MSVLLPVLSLSALAAAIAVWIASRLAFESVEERLQTIETYLAGVLQTPRNPGGKRRLGRRW